MQKLAVLAALAFLAAAGAAQAQQPPAGRDPMARLMRADANHDGSITRAEARAAREQAFSFMDSDHDGYLSAAEREARRGGREGRSGLGAMMGRRDGDGDGRISRVEFLGGGAPGFDRFDSNNNDVLEPGELEAARQMMAARRAARQTQTE